MQLLEIRANQMLYPRGLPGDDMQSKSEHESKSTPWNDRILMAADIVTMVLSVLGYMHA